MTCYDWCIIKLDPDESDIALIITSQIISVQTWPNDHKNNTDGISPNKVILDSFMTAIVKKVFKHSTLTTKIKRPLYIYYCILLDFSHTNKQRKCSNMKSKYSRRVG